MVDQPVDEVGHNKFGQLQTSQCIDLPSPGDITVAGEGDTYIVLSGAVVLCNLQCNGGD